MTINIGIGSENSDIVNLNKIQSLANREANLADKDFYLKTREKAVKVKEEIDIVANEKKGILDTLVIEQKFDELASLRQPSGSWAWGIRDPNQDAFFRVRSAIPPKLKAALLAARADDIPRPPGIGDPIDFYTLSQIIDQFLEAQAWSSSEKTPSTASLGRTGSTLKSVELIDPSSGANPIIDPYFGDYRIDLWGYSKSIHYVKAVIEYEIGGPIEEYTGPSFEYPYENPNVFWKYPGRGELGFESYNLKKGYGGFGFPYDLRAQLEREGGQESYPFVRDGQISSARTLAEYRSYEDLGYITFKSESPFGGLGTPLNWLIKEQQAGRVWSGSVPRPIGLESQRCSQMWEYIGTQGREILPAPLIPDPPQSRLPSIIFTLVPWEWILGTTFLINVPAEFLLNYILSGARPVSYGHPPPIIDGNTVQLSCGLDNGYGPTFGRIDGTILAYPSDYGDYGRESYIQGEFSSDGYTLDKPGNYEYVRMNRVSQDKVELYFKCKPGLSRIALTDYRSNLPGRKIKVSLSYGNYANIFTPY
jgi:hypothetical protein